MADIAGGVLKGFSQGAQLGILQEQREEAKAQQEREAARKKRLSGLLGSFASSNKGVLGEIAATGPEGIAAASQISSMNAAQAKQAAEQYKNGFMALLALPEQERADGRQALIASAVGSGLLDEQVADQLSNAALANPAGFDEQMSRYFGIEPEETALVKNVRAAGIDPASETGRKLIADSIAGKSSRISFSPDGSVEITEGAAATKPLGKKTRGDLEGDVLSDTEQLDRLENIEEQFNEDFLRGRVRLGMEWAAMKDRWGELSPEERAELEEFTAFRSSAIGNLNSYIQSVTGAAMSEKEADRIRQAVPDPGEGVFDGDSPAVFMSKLRTVVKDLKLARARKQYALKREDDWQKISLESMKDILRKEERRMFEEEGWASGLSPEEQAEIIARVTQRLREEYGY